MAVLQHVGSGYTRDRALRDIAESSLWPYSLRAAAGHTYPYHHHETDETLYVIDGELLFTAEHTQEQRSVRSGDKMLIAAGQGHTVKAIADTTYLMGLRDFIPLEDFPVWHEPADLTVFFTTLAQQFAEAEQYPAEPRDYSATRSRQHPREKETGEAFYRRLLADDLKFRRAGGPPPVDKDAFLAGLTNPKNITTAIGVSEIEVIPFSADLVLVSLVVTLTGQRGGNAIDKGRYRNVRVFARNPGEWQCLLWFNTPA